MTTTKLSLCYHNDHCHPAWVPGTVLLVASCTPPPLVEQGPLAPLGLVDITTVFQDFLSTRLNQWQSQFQFHSFWGVGALLKPFLIINPKARHRGELSMAEVQDAACSSAPELLHLWHLCCSTSLSYFPQSLHLINVCGFIFCPGYNKC